MRDISTLPAGASLNQGQKLRKFAVTPDNRERTAETGSLVTGCSTTLRLRLRVAGHLKGGLTAEGVQA
jgi:hypothetical protein